MKTLRKRYRTWKEYCMNSYEHANRFTYYLSIAKRENILNDLCYEKGHLVFIISI